MQALSHWMPLEAQTSHGRPRHNILQPSPPANTYIQGNVKEFHKNIGLIIIFRNIFYRKMIKQLNELILLIVFYIFHKSDVKTFWI